MDWDTQYYVPVHNIRIGKYNIDYNYDKINYNGGKAFLDSGTTFIYVDYELYYKILKTLNKACSENKKNCNGKGRYKED